MTTGYCNHSKLFIKTTTYKNISFERMMTNSTKFSTDSFETDLGIFG